tara:strand:+ start:1717 stop:2826 length:1110 start_codon:yes stop_codon:yes gene_type:complete
MKLKTLNLVNFKNYTEVDFKFSDKINFFLGNNGVGKTNILDSIHYLSFSKSYFNHIDSLNIKYGELFFSINSKFLINNLSYKTYLAYEKNKLKVIRVNDEVCEKFSSHIGKFPIIISTPLDSNLILGSAETRRKFIDILICQFDKIYLNHLINYKRLIKQRNILLKQFFKKKYFSKDDIEIYNDQLVVSGNYIFNKRKEIINLLKDKILGYYNSLLSYNENIDIVYKSQLSENSFSDLLNKNIEKDKILCYTSSGIHRDDIDFFINGLSMKKTGSQGQQKSFTLSLKFAEFELLKKMIGFKPLFLIDDLFDKLDKGRVSSIISFISTNDFGQIFITDTDLERIKLIIRNTELDFKFFSIKNNKVDEEIF